MHARAGLKAEDFEPISLNGFDPEDNRIDINDYAWSMEYFEPDGDGVNRLYAATLGQTATLWRSATGDPG